MPTVTDIKEALVQHGYNMRDLNKLKKPELLSMLNSENQLDNISMEDFEIVEDEVEVTEMADPQPAMNSPEWSEYVISKFEPDEIIDGNPTVDGLRRIAELVLGPIVDVHTEIVQVPTKENQGRSTATCKVTVYMPEGYTKSASGSGDAWHKNTDMPYSKFPVAMAETRAEGRALRRLLQLRKVVAAEELADSVDESADYSTNISENQINFIEVFCRNVGRGMNINVQRLVNSDGRKYVTIQDLSHSEATAIIQKLSTYQQNTDEIPV
jgi:hypothetical protein